MLKSPAIIILGDTDTGEDIEMSVCCGLLLYDAVAFMVVDSGVVHVLLFGNIASCSSCLRLVWTGFVLRFVG